VETRQNDDDQSDGQPQRHAVGTIPRTRSHARPPTCGST
jgi:hypothetical protein